MKTNLSQFLNKLADLMQEHDVELEALEEGRGNYTFCTGIEVTARGKYDQNGNQIRPTEAAKLSRWPDVTNIRVAAERVELDAAATP